MGVPDKIPVFAGLIDRKHFRGGKTQKGSCLMMYDAEADTVASQLFFGASKNFGG